MVELMAMRGCGLASIPFQLLQKFINNLHEKQPNKPKNLKPPDLAKAVTIQISVWNLEIYQTQD
jgi:hypothetical protein